MNLDDSLRRSGKALRDQTAASIDLDEALVRTLNRPTDGSVPTHDPNRRLTVLLIAASSLVVAAGFGLWSMANEPETERLVPAAPVITDEPLASQPPVVTEPEAELEPDPFVEGFSAAAVFSALPGLEQTQQFADNADGPIGIAAADLDAVDAATGLDRSTLAAEEWLNTIYGFGSVPDDPRGLALFPPSFPPQGSGDVGEQDRRDELGFGLTDVDLYATMSSIPTQNYFGVYRGEQLALGDQFVDLGNGVRSLGAGEDMFRSRENISPLRPLGQPVRATETTGLVAVSSSTASISDWRNAGPRLIDDERLRTAAQVLDTRDLIDVSTNIMDFSASVDAVPPERVVITEPFSVLAVGTSVDDGVFTNVIAYVFDDPTAAEAMQPVIDAAWHQPSVFTDDTPADFYTSIEVTTSGSAVVVTAPLKTTTHTSKWFEFFARPEPIFLHAPVTESQPLDSDTFNDPCTTDADCLRYTIQAGDFPLRIAQAFCVTIEDIVSANGWTDIDADFPGVDAVIIIPPAPPTRCPDPLGQRTAEEFAMVSGDLGTAIDVRNASDVIASYDLRCPSDSDCVVQSARVMDDMIWVAVVETERGETSPIVRSRITSITRSAGEVTEHLALDSDAAVQSAGRGIDGVLYAHLDNGNFSRSLVAVNAGQVRLLEANVSGFRLSDDGRFLAVSYSNPPVGETARFEISNLVDQSTISFETPHVNAGPGEWSPDGRFLIVDEQWENRSAWVIDPWSGSGDPLPGAAGILDGACFMSDGVIAHRTWNVGSGQGDAQLGTIRLTSLDTGSTIAEFGDGIFGDAFRCHADGSISYLRHPVIDVELSTGFTQLEPDPNAPVELIHIATDGTTSTLAIGDLRML